MAFCNVFRKITSAGIPGAELFGELHVVSGGKFTIDAGELNFEHGSFGLGTFNSTTQGYGVELNETTSTAALRVYADDGGHALTPTGAVGDIRGGISRFLITANQAAVKARAWGFIGQAKIYDCTFSNEQIGGINGRMEVVQSAGTVTLAGNGVTSGVCGTFATAGTTTISADHVAAGVSAIADIKGTCTQTGKVAGFYVGKYDTTNWSDATAHASWGYGLLIGDSVATTGIQIGTCTTAIDVNGGTTGIDFAGATTMTQNIILGGNGRISTATAAGASCNIDGDTSAYGEGLELRYAVTDWSGTTATLTEGTGMYLRMENQETNNAASIYGAQIYGVSNNVANTKNLWGAICYAYIKGAAGLTATGVYAFQPEISFDAETASSTITEAAVVRAKITGGTMAAYTNMHGYKLIAGDMNGGTRTYGNAFWVMDDGDMSGTTSWTIGLNLAATCTTGIAIESSTTAIAFGAGDGKIVDAASSLSIYGGNTGGDDLILYGNSSDTTSLSILGATGLSILGTVTTGLDISTASTSGISINTATPTQGILISAACGTHAINISGAQTGAGITIGSTCGTYGLNIAGACTTAAIKFGVGGGSVVDGAASLIVCGGDTARDDLILYGSSVVTSRGTVMVGDFVSSYTTPGQTGLGIPLGNATNADIRAFIVAATDGTIQPTKRIESSCHSLVQSMDWSTTTLSATALEGVFYGGFDLISTSDNINISGVGGWVYLNDESGFAGAGTTPVIGTASGRITYVAGVESFVTLPTSYEIKANGVVCGLKLSNCFKAPGTNTGAGYTYNIYTETVDAVGYDYFWGTNAVGNGIIVNALTIGVGVATAYALKLRIAGVDHYIPVFSDLSWNA